MVNSGASKEDLLDTIKVNNSIINSVPIGFCITNDKGIYEFVNKAYCKMYGYEKEELIGEHFSKVTIKENTTELIEIHDKFLNKGSELKKQWVVKKKNGEKFNISACAAKIIGKDGKPKKVTYVSDITEQKILERKLKEANSKLKKRAIRDSLTGLYNHGETMERLRSEINRSSHTNSSLTIMMIDIDDFRVEYNKKNKEVINDKLEEQENFTIIEEINDKYYVANFINIKNFNQEPVGYFIIYNESKMINYLNRNFKVMCIVLTLSFIFISGLILKLFRNNKRLNYLAKRDRLTGVYNRHKIEEILNLELNRANRYDLKFSILILDIDYFKEVNDTYGHNKGDQVLKKMCNLIGKNIRDADTLGRWGGEEFIIIAPETNIDKSFQLANKLRKIISQYNFIKDKKVTVSIGLAEYENNYSIDEIISRADQALYKAKNNGRNRAEKF